MERFYSVILSVVLGFMLDFAFGDPRWIPHPITAIGKLISAFERLWLRVFPATPGGRLFGGFALCVCVAGLTFSVSYFLLYIAGIFNVWVCFALQTWFAFQILAMKSLKTESMKVYNALKRGDLADARLCLSMIVGRDTSDLSEREIAVAAVETVAENTSDGVIAPIFWLLVGGIPLGFLYKAVNTLDSMVGYKNDKYLYFGRMSAKLDDIMNWIPSRLSGIFMIGGAFILGTLDKRFDGKAALRIFRRDRLNHPSPNSAQTESSCAGALNVQLGGGASYFGEFKAKPTIGDDVRVIEAEDINLANRLMYVTCAIALIILCAAAFAAVASVYRSRF
jgi:adenosylcobinamide-phosphate synthase